MFTLPATTCDVGELLSSAHAVEKTENRRCLLKTISSLRLLARQGMGIRGSGDERDSNVNQCIQEKARNEPKVTSNMHKLHDFNDSNPSQLMQWLGLVGFWPDQLAAKVITCVGVVFYAYTMHIRT